MSKTLKRVLEEFQEREKRGVSKYGTTVDRDDLEEWQWVQHAKEEAMDQVMYLQRLEDALFLRAITGRANRTQSPSGDGGSPSRPPLPTEEPAWMRLLRTIARPFGGTSAGSIANEQKRGET